MQDDAAKKDSEESAGEAALNDSGQPVGKPQMMSDGTIQSAAPAADGDASMAPMGSAPAQAQGKRDGKRNRATPMDGTDVEAVLALAPDARMQALIAMSPQEMMSFQAALRPAERPRLMQGLTPA